MRAIEAIGEIGKDGQIKLEKPLDMKGGRVKVIILIPDDEEIDDALWIKVIGTSGSFDFLRDEEEDIYTVADGKPVVPEV